MLCPGILRGQSLSFAFGKQMSIILPIVIFASWFALSLAPCGKLAIEDAQNKVPADKRRGVSIVPGLPAFPLILWGAAVAIDRFISSWGSWILLGIHGVLLLICLSVITRDILRLKRIST